MDRLKNRREFIPNGFWFVDASISDQPMGNQAWDFFTLCRNVLARRQQNPSKNLATDMPSIELEVDQQNAARMRRMKGAEIYITSDGDAPSPNSQAPRNRSFLGVVAGAKQVVAGVGVLLDWLGSGAQPVAPASAEQRAAVCRTCPKNEKGDLFAIFTQPVAEKIRSQLSIKRNMNLTTSADLDLHVCSACHCPLELKVHVPITHIGDHTTLATKAALDPRCWILKELTT